MAVHIDTASMASPRHYSSHVLNHLGLVAGMYDELGLGELIDQELVQDEDSRIVSLGQAVKAMVLNSGLDGLFLAASIAEEIGST